MQARLVYTTSRTQTSFYRAEHRAAHERLSSFTPLVPTAIPAADEIHKRKHQCAVELLGQQREQNSE